MECCGFVWRKTEEKGMKIKQTEKAEIAEETVVKEKKKKREKTVSGAD
jgi:hypothetical protein